MAASLALSLSFCVPGSMSYPRIGYPPVHFPFLREATISSRVRSLMSSRSNCPNESRMFRVSRPIECAVLNCCVTDTKEQFAFSSTSMIFAKSMRLRESRSTLQTTMQSTSPFWASCNSRRRPGRSIVPPENPPSEYSVFRAAQPSCFWEAMKASAASRWASRELNSCWRPSVTDLRV